MITAMVARFSPFACALVPMVSTQTNIVSVDLVLMAMGWCYVSLLQWSYRSSKTCVVYGFLISRFHIISSLWGIVLVCIVFILHCLIRHVFYNFVLSVFVIVFYTFLLRFILCIDHSDMCLEIFNFMLLVFD